jgi:hypothetical protein
VSILLADHPEGRAADCSHVSTTLPAGRAPAWCVRSRGCRAWRAWRPPPTAGGCT